MSYKRKKVKHLVFGLEIKTRKDRRHWKKEKEKNKQTSQ